MREILGISGSIRKRNGIGGGGGGKRTNVRGGAVFLRGLPVMFPPPSLCPPFGVLWISFV